MKIFYLKPYEFIIAIIIGLFIVFTIMFTSMPHPVESTLQVITPVPTPAPVIQSNQQPVVNYGIMTVGENSYTLSSSVTNYGIITYNGNCPTGFTGPITNKVGGIDSYINWCGSVNS